MTSHELARLLLERDNSPIVAFDPDSEAFEEISGIVVDPQFDGVQKKVIIICTEEL